MWLLISAQDHPRYLSEKYLKATVCVCHMKKVSNNCPWVSFGIGAKVLPVPGGRTENLGVRRVTRRVVIGGHNLLPPQVEIVLTNIPKSGGCTPLYPPFPPLLVVTIYWWVNVLFPTFTQPYLKLILDTSSVDAACSILHTWVPWNKRLHYYNIGSTVRMYIFFAEGDLWYQEMFARPGRNPYAQCRTLACMVLRWNSVVEFPTMYSQVSIKRASSLNSTE